MCPTHSPSDLSWKAAAAAALTKATRSEPMSAPLADVSRNDLNLNQIANATPITDVIRLPCMPRSGEARVAESTERTVSPDENSLLLLEFERGLPRFWWFLTNPTDRRVAFCLSSCPVLAVWNLL